MPDLPRGLGDPDFFGYPGEKPAHIKYVGEDKVIVNRQAYEPDLSMPTWYDQDNNARSPLEADWEPIESDTN